MSTNVYWYRQGRKNTKRSTVGNNEAALKKQRLFTNTVITIALLGFLIPLVSLFLFSIRFPLTGVIDWGGWVGLFEFQGARQQTAQRIWEGMFNSLIMAAITIVLLLLLLIPTMV